MIFKFKEFIYENIQNEEYLYHGTSYKNAINIINNGFNQETYWGDKNTAENYAFSYSKPTLIKILKEEIYNLLEPNYTLINYYEDNIENSDDNDYENILKNWENSNKTPQDSLNIIGSCILPPTYLNIDKSNIIKL